MKGLSAASLCLIIGAIVPAGAWIDSVIGLLGIGPDWTKPFGNMILITQSHALTVPECFKNVTNYLIRIRSKIVTSTKGETENIKFSDTVALIWFEMERISPDIFEIAGELGDLSSLEGEFMLLILARPVKIEEWILEEALPLPDNFAELEEKPILRVHGFDKGRGAYKKSAECTFSKKDLEMELVTKEYQYNRQNWIGGPVLHNKKLIAICFHQDVNDFRKDKLSCRSIFTYFNNSVIDILPKETKDIFYGAWRKKPQDEKQCGESSSKKRRY